MSISSLKTQFLAEAPATAQTAKETFGNSTADFSKKYLDIEASLAETAMSPAQVKQAANDVFKAANGNKALAEAEIQKSIKASTDGIDSIVIRNGTREYKLAPGQKLNRYGSAFDAEASNPAVINLRNNIIAANSIRLELNKIK
jgi:RecA/RadA recombinase